MTEIYWTGIGSRETPPEVCRRMTKIAQKFQEMGYILRSGGAQGADAACEAGAGDLKQIFLPWNKFEGRIVDNKLFFLPKKEAFDLAATIHPVWDKLTDGAKRLHARNCHQVLGPNLDTPSKLLICWTMGGGERGGTATAMKLAKMYGVPIKNLFEEAA